MSCTPPLPRQLDLKLNNIGYSIVGELPSSRLRSRSIVLGRFFYLVSAIIGTQLRARMVAVDAWNWGPKVSCPAPAWMGYLSNM